MAKTSKDAWRHIREWSQFFSDMKSVSEEVVDLFLEKQKKKKHLKQSLRRLKERGFLVRDGSVIRPTRTGAKFFRRHALALSHNRVNPLPWDGKWRLISFDVPVKKDPKRYELRALLREFNFYPVQKSVWACPNQMVEGFWKLLVDYELDSYCKAMVVEIVEGDKELKKHFKLT